MSKGSKKKKAPREAAPPVDTSVVDSSLEETVALEKPDVKPPGDQAALASSSSAEPPSTPNVLDEPPPPSLDDIELTVNLTGDLAPLPGRDDLDEPTVALEGALENSVAEKSEPTEQVDHALLQRKHLRGLLEALVFASDAPIKPNELAKLAHAPQKQVKELLAELREEYAGRGMQLDEVAGGYCFRTSPQYAPFIRDLTKQKPVRLTRAQVETLAIIAYRQPITRPEVDDVRGVDSGPVLKLLLERDLVRILGKRDEPGRPLIYGTTTHFLEFFGLRSLKDLPTLREFTELTEESRQTYEEELGDAPPEGALPGVDEAPDSGATTEMHAAPSDHRSAAPPADPVEAALADEPEGEGDAGVEEPYDVDDLAQTRVSEAVLPSDLASGNDIDAPPSSADPLSPADD